jgi:hypothetical protein
MPDISMCGDQTCPSRKKCYRYRAIPNGQYQCWACFKHSPDTGLCEHFMVVYPNSKSVLPEEEVL